MDQLERLPGLRFRRMFGAYGMYCEDVFFGIISKSRLYFKTDEKTRADYIGRESSPFRPNPDQELQNYYEVPIEVLEDRDQLVQWATDALGASTRAKRRKTKSGKR